MRVRGVWPSRFHPAAVFSLHTASTMGAAVEKHRALKAAVRARHSAALAVPGQYTVNAASMHPRWRQLCGKDTDDLNDRLAALALSSKAALLGPNFVRVFLVLYSQTVSRRRNHS